MYERVLIVKICYLERSVLNPGLEISRRLRRGIGDPTGLEVCRTGRVRVGENGIADIRTMVKLKKLKAAKVAILCVSLAAAPGPVSTRASGQLRAVLERHAGSG